MLYRFPLFVRLPHALAATCLYILLLSGLQIFNAHPALYWGAGSDFEHPLLALLGSEDDNGRDIGITEVLGHQFDTTGLLGASADADGDMHDRGFPAWLTIPGPRWLAKGRAWHFFFAWLLVGTGAVYAGFGLWSRHLQRDLVPTRADWRGIGRSVIDHALLRHPHGEAAARYNILQRLSYLGVLGALAPALILTGLAMSPRMDTVLGPLIDLAGGRQSMRTLHFLATCALIAFFLVHIFEVLVTGAFNNLRSIITGRFRVEPEAEPENHE